MKEIIQATAGLSEGDLKPYLRFILAQIKRLKEQDGPAEAAVAELIEMYDELIGLQDRRNSWDPVPECAYVHIVVGDSFAGSMKQALLGLGWKESHRLIVLRENYAIGPIHGLNTPEGRSMRAEWLRDNIAYAMEAYSEPEEEYLELLDKVALIPDQAEIIIWSSGNGNEQTGLRHAIHLLTGKENVIAIYDACTICEELYNRPDAYIDYRHSGEITADKLRGALVRMDGSGRLNGGDIKRLEQEWQKFTRQTGVLRIWLDGNVCEVPADYFDAYLLEKLDGLRPPDRDRSFLKSVRLIGEALGYCEQSIGDAYFEYRVRQLIYDGVLEIKGVPAGMRYYSIRRRQKADSGTVPS